MSSCVGGLGTRPELVTGERRFNVDLIGGWAVEWSLFDGGAAGARGEEREAAAGALRERARAVRDERVAALRVAARRLETAAADVSAGRETLERAERALTILQDQYQEGIGIQLEVLEAEADLTRARAILLRAIHAYRGALIELRRAAGLAADAPLPGQSGGES